MNILFTCFFFMCFFLSQEAGRILRRARFQAPSSANLLALTEFRERVLSEFLSALFELTEFFAELTEFATELSEFSLPKQCSRNSIPPVSQTSGLCSRFN